MNQPSLDRLVLLTILGPQAEKLMKILSGEDFHFTVINSTSQVMQETEICLLIGLSQVRLPKLLELVRQCCKSYRKFIPTQSILPGELASLPMVEAQLGGALIYMMEVERFEQI